MPSVREKNNKRGHVRSAVSKCDRHVLLFSSPFLSSAVTASRSTPPSPSISLHLPNDMWVAVSISVHAHPPRVRRCAGSFASQERQKFILNPSQCRPSAVRPASGQRRRKRGGPAQGGGPAEGEPPVKTVYESQRLRCIEGHNERRHSVASECAASILRLVQTVANACCQPRQ